MDWDPPGRAVIKRSINAGPAVTRTYNKITARGEYLVRRAKKQTNLGKNTHPLNSETHAEPLASFEDQMGEVTCTYSKPFKELLAELDIQTSPTKTR